MSWEEELDEQGFAVWPGVLGPEECEEIAGWHGDRVVMARHGFGRGEYQYFAYPLPERVEAIRTVFYARLAPVANRSGMGAFPDTHAEYHGPLVFPLQVAILLSAGFTGGEFVMTEQRPRMQSRAMVVPLRQGDAVVFPVHTRPVRGTRGTYKVNMRHGVSRILYGERHTLGIIFHDAAV